MHAIETYTECGAYHLVASRHVPFCGQLYHGPELQCSVSEGRSQVERKELANRHRPAPEAEGFPQKSDWESALPLHFDQDWRGDNADPARATEVRLLWTPETLFLRFQANYRDLNLYPDSREDGWRDKLWD